MKNYLNLLLVLILSVSMSMSTFAQDALEENESGFSLEGALELFKASKSPEDFEKRLNDEENFVNNLDLNEDGDTDYVKVEDHMDGEVHAIVLSIDVSDDETQDVAVIEIEKTGNKSAMLQIIGDENLFESGTIVEPYDAEMDEDEDGKGGPSADFNYVRITVNVWLWPSVNFVYRPAYRPWVSPYRYRVYPRWWNPWRVRPVHVWRPGIKVHHHHYRHAKVHRVTRAHKVYTPRRRSSVTVSKRTTVVKRKNGKVVGKKTSKSVTVKNKNNKGKSVTKKKSKTTTVKKSKKGKTKTVRKTKTKKVKKKRG